jgi:hypothetical protein
MRRRRGIGVVGRVVEARAPVTKVRGDDEECLEVGPILGESVADTGGVL